LTRNVCSTNFDVFFLSKKARCKSDVHSSLPGSLVLSRLPRPPPSSSGRCPFCEAMFIRHLCRPSLQQMVIFYFLEIYKLYTVRCTRTEALPGVWQVRRANEEVPHMQKTIWKQVFRPMPGPAPPFLFSNPLLRVLKTWGFPSQFINQPRGYGHTTRATPGVSLPSGSRTRNLRILDPAYKPLRCSGDTPITHFSDAGTTAANHARLLTGHCTSGDTTA
jgi:hypothetical protein